MGNELVSDSLTPQGGELKSSTTFSYYEMFMKHLPYYLSIGMSYELYWCSDCALVKSFREAEKLKKNKKNQELWLQGMYFYEALCDTAPIINAFSKANKPTPYSSEPYCLSVKEIEEKKEREERLRFEKIKSKTELWAERFNAQFTKGKEE